MNTDSRERLSALMDDELTRQELKAAVGQLRDDDELKQHWDRWHLIGDTIRGEADRLKAEGVAASISRALQDEPTIIAPPIKPAGETPVWLKPAVGTALAASIAVMAVMVAPNFVGDSGQTVSSPMVVQSMQPISVPAAVVPVSTREPMTLYANQPGTRWKVVAPEVQAKLNSLLVNHQDFAPATNMTGMLPYATFVGYDVEK